MSTDITRREMLIGASVASAAAMAGSMIVGKVSNAQALSSKLSAEDVAFDDEHDIVVVGAGGAGLSACLTAVESGATVLAVEGEGAIENCNTSMSGGVFMAYGTQAQIDAGYEGDTLDNFIAYLDSVAEGLGNTEVQHLWAEQSLPTYNWLIDEGVVFPPELLYVSGMEALHADVADVYPRGHKTENMTGYDITKVLYANAEALGAEFAFDDAAVHLVVDDKTGGVVGVQTESGKYHKAAKGVIISCAGYSRSEKYIDNYLPSLVRGGSFGSLRQNGEGITMCLEAGAQIGCMWMTMCKSDCTRISDEYVTANIIGTMNSPCIMVTKDGVRGIAEDTFYETVYDWLAEDSRYMIWDQAVTDEDPAILFCPPLSEGLVNEVKSGAIFKADTVEDLADKMGLPSDALAETVTHYNDMMEAGKDEDFGRINGLGKIETPPYYGSNFIPGVADTGGGMAINTSFQVLDNFDEPIMGLYAAGTNAAGWRGANYPGSGTAVGFAVTSGRLAAKSILGIDY